MKSAVQLKAETRATIGTGSAREVRRQGKVPVAVYAKGKTNVNLAVDANILSLNYFRGGFMNKIVSLQVDGKDLFAIPREIQLNPVSDKIEHADFLAVDEKSIVKVLVPVHFNNVEKSVGIKRGGVLNIVRHAVEVFAPVTSIPPSIEIDVTELNIGDSIHLHNIKLPTGVTPAIKREDFTIASLTGRQKEEEEVATAAPVAGAVPASTAKAVEGAAGAAAAPAAGAAKAPAAKK
jgi:large subunit ribosomal protein L25